MENGKQNTDWRELRFSFNFAVNLKTKIGKGEKKSKRKCPKYKNEVQMKIYQKEMAQTNRKMSEKGHQTCK